MARVAGYRSPLAYVMARLDALEIYDKDSKKFIPENPEDQFNLSEDELDFLFVNANATKNLILLSEKGELDADSAKETLLKIRVEGNTVDTLGNRRLDRRLGNFIWPGTEVKTIEDVYILAKSGKYDNFGLYGFSSEELIELIDSGIVSRDANFNDENIQDYLAFGLMRIQANKSNSIIGANTEALSWNRLANLNESEQELIIRYFPSLRDMPMNQFQNLQSDISNAILTDVEDYHMSTSQLVESKPELAELFKDQDTLFNFIRGGSEVWGVYDEELANDPRRKEIYEHFQGLIREGKHVPGPIRRILHLTDGRESGFNYFETKPMEEE